MELTKLNWVEREAKITGMVTVRGRNESQSTDEGSPFSPTAFVHSYSNDTTAIMVFEAPRDNSDLPIDASEDAFKLALNSGSLGRRESEHPPNDSRCVVPSVGFGFNLVHPLATRHSPKIISALAPPVNGGESISLSKRPLGPNALRQTNSYPQEATVPLADLERGPNA